MICDHDRCDFYLFRLNTTLTRINTLLCWPASCISNDKKMEVLFSSLTYNTVANIYVTKRLVQGRGLQSLLPAEG